MDTGLCENGQVNVEQPDVDGQGNECDSQGLDENSKTFFAITDSTYFSEKDVMPRPSSACSTKVNKW